MTCKAPAHLYVQVTTPTPVSPGSYLGVLRVQTLYPQFLWRGSPGTVDYVVRIEALSGTSFFYEERVGNVDSLMLPAPLVDGAIYQWCVAAYTPEGILTSFSNWYQLLINPPEVVLPTPALTSPDDGENVTTVSPTLVWESVFGAVGYVVEVSSDVDFLDIVETADGVVMHNYTLSTALTPGATYHWRVHAYDLNGDISPAVSRAFVIHVLPGLATPVAPINSVTVDRQHIDLSWLPGQYAARHFVRVATDFNFTSLVYFSRGIEGTSLHLPTLSPAKYYWSVQSLNDSGSSAWTTYHAFFVS